MAADEVRLVYRVAFMSGPEQKTSISFSRIYSNANEYMKAIPYSLNSLRRVESHRYHSIFNLFFTPHFYQHLFTSISRHYVYHFAAFGVKRVLKNK